MTAETIRRRFDHLEVEGNERIPESQLVLAPTTPEEAAAVLDAAAEHQLPSLFWGSGSHQGYGHRIRPAIVIATERMNRILDWSPADLTVVAEAGVRVADLAGRLLEEGQTAVLPERPGASTVGGAIAAGQSGWGRLRYGPIRDRTLEVVLATGDGRVVRAGAPLVKNVTGYDLPRLATGSFGALGLITRVALKLWPLGFRAATVTVEDAEEALATAHRPLAVVEENGTARVYLTGTPAEVEAQTAELGGTAIDQLDWPEVLTGETVLVVRVPPGLTRAATDRVPPGWSYQAAFGVGEVRLAGTTEQAAEVLGTVRAWAEAVGGAAVVERAPETLYEEVDPWGGPGSSLELQRRVKAAFDPLGICNPGRLPGKL
jgi:glycolate oxidase FAD binding subunit